MDTWASKGNYHLNFCSSSASRDDRRKMKREKQNTSNALEESPAINTRAEEKKVEERLAIGPHIVYETIRREGEEEFKRSSAALGWSGLAAGLSMGFSLVAEALLAAHLPHASWTPLISKFGYSVGFLIVILGRQQLFTETTLTVILPLLAKQTLERIFGVLRLWSVILGANLVGTFIFALCIGKIALFSPEFRQVFLAVSQEGVGSGFGIVLVRAIFAGWLIALTVWLLPVAKSARVSIIIILTYLIGLAASITLSLAHQAVIWWLPASRVGARIFCTFSPDIARKYYWGSVAGCLSGPCESGGRQRNAGPAEFIRILHNGRSGLRRIDFQFVPAAAFAICFARETHAFNFSESYFACCIDLAAGHQMPADHIALSGGDG